MARTRKHAVAPGKEYWKSRLHSHGEEPGWYTKGQTHRKERRVKRQAIVDEMSTNGASWTDACASLATAMTAANDVLIQIWDAETRKLTGD